MCHKLVQTAVGRLHFEANMVGGGQSPPAHHRVPWGGLWTISDVCSRAVRGPQFVPPTPRAVLFCWSSFATKDFNEAFCGPFKICHLHHFTNSWLWIDGHFREVPLWSRNLLNVSPAAEHFCSLNLSLNDKFADRNGTRPHPMVFPCPPTPNTSFHSHEMHLTP